MVSIFAGMDDTGAVRFLNEVQSGLACGCFCMVCGATLIARKGEINEWHFSHESGQQRPECLAGARNLVRRYVEDFLTTRSSPPIPDVYQTWATCEHERVAASWNTKILGIEDWRDKPGPNTPAAKVLLERGFSADLYVVVGDEQHSPAPLTTDRGSLLARVPMPDALYLRSREQLMAHLAKTIVFQWLALPDIFGVLASAEEQAHQAAQAQQRHRAALQEAAGRRWAQIRRRASDAIQDVAESAEALSIFSKAAPAADQPQTPALPPMWALDIKPLSNIFCYRFKDGSRWVLYQTVKCEFLLKPWPMDEEGWDEALPPSIGRADVGIGGYRVAGFAPFAMAVRDYFDGMRNTSNPHEVPELFHSFG